MHDLIIIGGGPAGYLAAERAGQAGMNTLLIEKRALGGVCLNEGCIPSKALLYSAKIYDSAKNGGSYGVHTEDIRLGHGEVVARKNKVVNTLTSGIKSMLASNKVEVVNGAGVLTGKNADGSFSVVVSGQSYAARRVLIATGSEPILPPIPGLHESLLSGFALTNREVLDLPAAPEHLVIVGGGVIGLEMASYYMSAGSKVTVVEMVGSIGGPLDEDIAAILLKNLKAKGIVFELNAKVVSIEATQEGGCVVFERDGERYEVPADKALVSIGRRPTISGFGIETVGMNAPKRIEVDRFMQTCVPNLYAAGDVTGEMLLAHVAYRQAEVAVAHMLGRREVMRYDAVPSVIYTAPEVGSIGETAKSAKQKQYEIACAKLPMNYSGRYLAENHSGNGICKLIVDKRTRRIIGCHIIGSYASEIISTVAALMESCATVERAKAVIFPHPTVGEIIKEAFTFVL